MGVRRKANHLAHDRPQFVVQPLQHLRRLQFTRSNTGQRPADHGITLFCARHGLHHVAREGRVQVAEEAHGAAIRPDRHENVDRGWLGQLLGFHGMSIFIESLEMTAVEMNVERILSRQHGVGLRSGRD
jgi:hypothetical protein